MTFHNYRFTYTTSTGHHVETLAFPNDEDADAYVAKEAAAVGAGKYGVEKMEEVQKYKVEVTDLYCGEANYSWVNRHEFFAPLGTPNRELVRRAKALQGWTGHRCETQDIGDMITVRPRGLLQIMFINYTDE